MYSKRLPKLISLTSIPISACTAPPIIFGTNPACPGASNIVNLFFSVSKEALPTSTVLPYQEIYQLLMCDSIYFISFLLVRVQSPREIPCLSVLLLSFSLIFF